MTAAEDRREELEAVIWRSLGKSRADLSMAWQQAHVAAVLAAADVYAKAIRPHAPRKPAAPKPPLAVHYGLTRKGGIVRPACRPADQLSGSGWVLTATTEAVTCGHSRKTDAWRDAARPGNDP
jgi:hypothetical protein